MKIKKIIIDGLFDLRYEIHFFDEINFLYGKNGSGKTTILDIISIIVSGNIHQLNKYSFKKLEFYAQGNGTDKIELLIEKDKERDQYHFMMNGLVGMIPKKQSVFRTSNHDNRVAFSISDEMDIDGLHIFKEGISSEYAFNNYRKAKKIIEESFSTIYLPLARREINNYGSVVNGFGRVGNINEERVKKKSDMDKSLENAIELVKEKFTMITYRDNEFLEQLKTQIVTHAFNNAFSTEDLLADELKSSEEDFESIFGQEFWGTIKDLKLNLEENKKIESDINNIKEAITAGKGSFTLEQNEFKITDNIKFGNYIIAISQLKKIKELVDQVNKINEKRLNIKHPINQLFNVVNRFFKDTNKEIFIEKQGELKFKRGNKKKINDVNVMSSGEKQILIFFIYAILQVKSHKSSLYMIDEPELSLHLEWQHIFVTSLKEILPNTQLIFATHSPEIIGDQRSKCVEVRGEEI